MHPQGQTTRCVMPPGDVIEERCRLSPNYFGPC